MTSATAASSMRPHGARLGLTWSTRKALTPWAFLLPSLLALAIVFFYPMLKAFSISLTADTLGGGRFVGLEQYRAVLTSNYFLPVIRTSILWTVGNVAFVLGVGLATALMLDRRFPGRAIARAMFILPWAIPYVAAGLIWGWMFDYEFG